MENLVAEIERQKLNCKNWLAKNKNSKLGGEKFQWGGGDWMAYFQQAAPVCGAACKNKKISCFKVYLVIWHTVIILALIFFVQLCYSLDIEH